jgi:hypothetical protein
MREPYRRPLRWRLREALDRARKALGFGRRGPEPGRDWPEEPSLVPLGPPRRPRPSSAVELEQPREPEDTDAYGRETG